MSFADIEMRVAVHCRCGEYYCAVHHRKLKSRSQSHQRKVDRERLERKAANFLHMYSGRSALGLIFDEYEDLRQ